MNLKRLMMMTLLITLTACASTVSKLPDLPSDGGAPYLLGAGDTLQIVVFGETDLSGTFRVSDSGAIAMPLAGVVPVAGLSIDQFQRRLAERLRANALKSPNVTVAISEYRPFFILGEVKSPGSYPYVPNMTVLTAVAIAGGFTFRASQNEISVVRQSGSRASESRAARDSRVLPGDVVNIFERHL
jgi:polysaccharide export outer membrane protein